MDFTEFREKYKISQDHLHQLVLEAHALYLMQLQEMEEYDIDPDDYEYEAGGARDENLNGFLRLLMDEDGE